MDVRCEKCQTEYELDEARLKPGGVTVKCTNCGHMFKIRKRSPTHVGAPPVNEAAPPRPATARPVKQEDIPTKPTRADSQSGDETVSYPTTAPETAGAAGEERQWLVRLDNGEQKACRELSMLQQWIVAGVVTRDSLISRTGKTWKRIGDISELNQYFTIGDEARTQRQDRTTKDTGKPAPTRPVKEIAGTMMGIGVATAAGGTILPDDDADLEGRTTGSYQTRPKTTPPPLPSAKTPPMGSNTSTAPSVVAEPAPAPAPVAAAPRRPATQPPPPPVKKAPDRAAPSVPISNRSTATWATDGVSPSTSGESGPAGPRGGRVKAASQEPAFAGRVRVMPGDDRAFSSGKVESYDDDDDVLPARRGSRAGLWIVLMLLLVGGAAAGAVYVFVIQKQEPQATATVVDAAVDAAGAGDAALVVTPVLDAAGPPPVSAVALARAELGADHETRLRTALRSLDGDQAPGADAMRGVLAGAIAQGLLDRAAITSDKSDAEKLKKDAKTIVADALGPAQRAVKALPDDPAANLAMADVLRLQGKPARDIKRYLDKANAKATPEWKRDLGLAEGLVLQRDGKLDDAKARFTAIDQGDDRLETSGDVRARLRLALIAYAQNKPADARPLVEQVLAAQPEHTGARELLARIETTVAKTDPLPPEDPREPTGAKITPDSGGGGGGGVESYDRVLARANTLAESNCGKAMELFSKALEQKPNGVEALTGMGYCHIDAKQFSSAFSKFRAALAVSARYEPALWGVAEAYQQQGRKEQALEAVKAYMEIYPNAPKAQKALDRLGGATPSPEPPPGGGTTEPTPTPDPTPPAPTPPPSEGAGSGSG